MKKRMGDAFLWALTAVGLMLSGIAFFLMKGSADPSFDKLIICAILFLPFYGIGWLIRYIFSGRTDLWINPTR